MLRIKSSICVWIGVIGIAAVPAGADPVTWDGGAGTDRWSHGDNWNPDGVPQSTDDVYHDNSDTIEMDMGSPISPYIIKSFNVDGSESGGLVIQTQKWMWIKGDFENDPSATEDYTLRLESRARLDIAPDSGAANLEGVDVTMVAGLSWLSPTSLEVSGAIIGGDFTGYDYCDLDVGTAPEAERSQLWGTWLLDGADAWFAKAEGTEEETPLLLTLANGARMDLEDMPYGVQLFPSYGELYYPEHELVYEGSDNELEVGVDGADIEHNLWVGEYSRIRGAGEDPELTLDVYGAFYTDSYFAHTWVYTGWDSRGVDIIAEPIFIPPETATSQFVEMISPDFGPYFQGTPVIFLDVPCHGAWRDFRLPDCMGGTATVTVPSHFYDNTVIDDGPLEWPERRDVGDIEPGLFRDISVGQYRELDLMLEVLDVPVMYYYGTLWIHPNAVISIQGTPIEEVPGVDIEDLIVQAVGSIYGDWNGDCAITNMELTALREAIAGGDETYNPLMDYDCDGKLTIEVELPAMLDNMTEQPPCGRGGGDGGGGGGESGSESYEGYDDVPGLAAWLTEVLSEEQLEAFVADLAVAAAEFADSPVGQDLAELLSCLE